MCESAFLAAEDPIKTWVIWRNDEKLCRVSGFLVNATFGFLSLPFRLNKLDVPVERETLAIVNQQVIPESSGKG